MHDYSNPHTQLKFSVASSWNTNTFWNTRSVVVSKSLVLCSVPSFACFAVASPRHRVICLVRSHFDWARRKARVERIPRLSCFCAHVRRALEAQLNSGACWFGQASVSSDRPSTEHRARDDACGAAAFGHDDRESRGHVAGSAVRRQAAHWGAPRAGSSADHQEEQV